MKTVAIVFCLVLSLVHLILGITQSVGGRDELAEHSYTRSAIFTATVVVITSI